MNEFLKAVATHDTFTENGAITNSTAGSALLDDFGVAGTYRARSFDDVSVSMSKIWAEDPLKAIQLTFYLRLISRTTNIRDKRTEKVQSGQGAKDEFRKRMVWLLYNHPEAFYANTWLIPVVGSYKDLWEIMVLDYTMGNQMDRTRIYSEMVHDIADESTRDLFLKYLPLTKCTSKLSSKRSVVLNTLASEFRKFSGLSAKDVRKLKAHGKAHLWQQLISNANWTGISWKSIPSRALSLLVGSKFLGNHDLEGSYNAWLETQPALPFKGYPFELGYMARTKTSHTKPYIIRTIDRQFEGMLALGRKAGGISGNVWCALDTSDSMTWESSKVPNTQVYAIDVCLSLGIYFSSLNEGAFKDHVVMFSGTSNIMKLAGTFSEKLAQCRSKFFDGGTNFQSVIDEIVRVRKTNPNIPLEDYPSTLIVISDMQFNPSGVSQKTNYERAMQKLEEAGLPKINIIWWRVNDRKVDYPSTMEDPGTYLFSGFDGNIISILLGGQTNKDSGPSISMEEAMNKCLSQEVLTHLKVN